MACASTHAAVGLVAGGITAAVKAPEEAPHAKLVEVLGGCWGGLHGGLTPDRLEPAFCPRHRGPAHSWVAALGIAAATLDFARAECRRVANDFAIKSRDLSLPPLTRILYGIAEVLFRFLAGALTGFKAGYASHLALDGCTPMGLPLHGF